MEQKVKYLFVAVLCLTCFIHCENKTGEAEVPADIAPGTNTATLTLGNGKIIQLDTLAHGQVAMQGATRIIKTADGEITYTSLAGGKHPDTTAATLQNSLTVPRGGHFRLILTDGTKVWLNAASAIRFPALFAKEKSVYIKGEAYFETSGNSDLPLIVRTYREAAKAFPASSFNVSCYDDERFVKISSVSGNISVGGNRLMPGEALENGLTVATNPQQDGAWSRDTFDFNNVFVEDAMRRLSRWYNIEIIYDMGIPVQKLTGMAPRSQGLKESLHYFSGQTAEFDLRPNALYVRPRQPQ